MTCLYMPITKGRFKKTMLGKSFSLFVKNNIQGVNLTKKGGFRVLGVRPRFKYEKIVLAVDIDNTVDRDMNCFNINNIT